MSSQDDDTFWYEVGKILDTKKHYEVNNYLVENQLMIYGGEKSKFANETLFQLYHVIHEAPVINYYLERDETLDKVLNIFIRVNSGGTPLSYSDLLLSIATAEWKEQESNARQVITSFVEDINRIGDGFNFNKDFVLKACLVLNDLPDIAFKVDNFKQENMVTIEKNWGKVRGAISLAVELLASFGFSGDTLTSNNAAIPIAYYLMKKGCPTNFVTSDKYAADRDAIQKWLVRSLLKRVFAGASDTFLSAIRQIIAEETSIFHLNTIIDRFRGGSKSILFADEEIEHLFSYQYGQSYTFSALALLYPSLDFRHKFQVDHIFPQSYFTRRNLARRGISKDKIDFYMENFNYLANLQLLEPIPNQEKSAKDFKTWLYEHYPDESNRREFMRRHYIPNIDLSLENFEEFIKERTRLMTEQFATMLQ